MTTTNLMPVVLWTQSGCGPCIGADRALKARRIPFVKIDVKHADTGRLARWRLAGMSTPVVETDGQSFSGVDVDKLDALALERGALVGS